MICLRNLASLLTADVTEATLQSITYLHASALLSFSFASILRKYPAHCVGWNRIVL